MSVPSYQPCFIFWKSKEGLRVVLPAGIWAIHCRTPCRTTSAVHLVFCVQYL